MWYNVTRKVKDSMHYFNKCLQSVITASWYLWRQHNTQINNKHNTEKPHFINKEKDEKTKR